MKKTESNKHNKMRMGISPTCWHHQRLLLTVLFVLLSVEQGLANSYYAKLTATTSATGKGLVYVDTDKGATPQYTSSKEVISKDGDNDLFSFYVWAKPTRGYLFAGWKSSGKAEVSNQSGIADEVTIKAGKKVQDESDATTGTVTAQWKEDSKYSITYKQPENGSYTVSYAYDILDNDAFQSKTAEYTLGASSDDQSVESYTGDRVTLSTDLRNFQGWYDGDRLLSTRRTYIYEVSKDATITGRFASEDEEHAVTFLQPSHGSYTAKYGEMSVGYGETVTTNQRFTLKATPEEGYHVVGWYVTMDGGKTKSYFSFKEDVSDYHFYQDVSVGCDFSNLPKAEFQVKGNASATYYDLNKADSAAKKEASKVVVLTKDGELISGQYTISAGNTLLIPYDDAYTVKTTKADVVTEDAGWEKPSIFRMLTMADGADITVEGGAAICVGGKQYTSSRQMSDNNGGPGAPIGPCGRIQMNRGGKITLKAGGNLYVWGFITGQNMDEGNNTTGVGTIEALSGATVYEDIVIADWHGGRATQNMQSGKKYFPFNQYFIPNIEVPLTIHYGAALNTVSDVYAGLVSKDPYSVPVPFIAKDDGGLFNMKSPGSTVKVWYDATTDRQHFELIGANMIKGITAKIETGFGPLTLDASNYVMPMTCNFDIRITQGTLTVPSDIALLPGSKVTLGKDATATINKGANVYIYDLDNWGLYAYGNYRKVFPFRPTKFKKYGQGDSNTKDVAKETGLADAQLVVDGTIDVYGSVYTTAAGADVCGTLEGKGTVNFITAPTSTGTTYQYIHGQPDGAEIPVTAVQLHNVDGSYVKTAGAAANTHYYYKNGYWTTLTQAKWDNADNRLALSNAYPVTVDDVEAGVKGKTFLAVDLTQSPAAIAVAEVRKAIGATDKNNILLYVGKGKAIGTDHNVVEDSTCADLVIADKQPLYVPKAFSADKVSYNRTNTSYAGSLQWGTICLPFELTSDSNGITYYQLSGISGNTMTFDEVSTVAPNTPAIYSAPTGSTLSFLNNADNGVAVSATTDNKVSAGGLTLVGVQTAPVTLNVGDNDYYIAQNKFWKPTKNAVRMNPQRAYFVASGTAKLASVFDISEGEATGVDVHGRDNEPGILAVYGVNGVKQDGLRRGINIIKLSDGSTKKIVIK